MIPSKKAKELVEKFKPNARLKTIGQYKNAKASAKQCALICCDEVLSDMGADRGYQFWVKVKQEITKL